jgi:FeS assembly SUF system protein
MEEGQQSGVRFEGDTRFREPVVAALKTIYDPEIPIDIYELGLIYGVRIAEDQGVRVEMTLTSPACPSAEALPQEVKDKVAAIEGLGPVNVDLVWDPPWTPEYMSDSAKLALGMW